MNTKSTRHKWNGKAGVLRAVSCIKCNCVKEIVKSGAIYFIDDNVYLKAPKCI